MTINPFWTADKIEELKHRWANWESFSEIARAIGHRSRNAVIGKAHRLGLKRLVVDNRPAKPQADPRLRRVRKKNAKNGHRLFDIKEGDMSIIDEEAPPVFPFVAPKRFIELAANDCRWPGAGQPGPDLLCCAAPVVHGYPYCAAHCRIAYTLGRPPRP